MADSYNGDEHDGDTMKRKVSMTMKAAAGSFTDGESDPEPDKGNGKENMTPLLQTMELSRPTSRVSRPYDNGIVGLPVVIETARKGSYVNVRRSSHEDCP